MSVGLSPGHGAPRLFVRIARSSGGYDRRMSTHVQTVLGSGSIPGSSAFTLPHEHTQCHLWQIPERFDYWELTPDEDLVVGRSWDASGPRADAPSSMSRCRGSAATPPGCDASRSGRG